jgi:2-dehydropantoate 2-reductase
MRFVMCGAGAVGGVIGGQLAKAGFEVVFVDPQADHVEAINRDGFQLRGLHGAHVLRVPAVTRAAEAGLRAGDVVVLSVKSFHTDAACRQLREATTLDLPVFCAQNGVRNEEIAARRFPDTHGVMVLIGAKRLVPGVVVHTATGPLGLGRHPEGLTDADRALATAIGQTDLPVYLTEHIVRAKWTKMLVNLNNATFGLIGLSGQEARVDPETREWMAEVYEEGLRVVQAAGIRYEAIPGQGSIEDRIRELRHPTASVSVPAEEELKHRPSLWQDLHHRRGEVEADHFNGEIVQLGRQHGVPTPYNSLLLELITRMATARELPGKYSVRALRARLAR